MSRRYKFAVLLYSNEPAGVINGTDDFIRKVAVKKPNLMMVQTYDSWEKASRACIAANNS